MPLCNKCKHDNDSVCDRCDSTIKITESAKIRMGFVTDSDIAIIICAFTFLIGVVVGIYL